MKRVIVVFILSVFSMNQLSFASYDNNNTLVKKLIQNKISAIVENINEEETSKLVQSAQDDLDKAENYFTSMSSTSFESLKQIAIKRVLKNNSIESANTIVNSLSLAELENLASSLSEEDVLANSSLRESVVSSISSEIKQSQLELARMYSDLSKESFVESIKETKEIIKTFPKNRWKPVPPKFSNSDIRQMTLGIVLGFLSITASVLSLTFSILFSGFWMYLGVLSLGLGLGAIFGSIIED